MLRSLRIRDLVIVDDLTVEFEKGLNLMTGETGAGKSIIVDALGLAVGRRADRTLVRSGAKRAVVEGLFRLAAESGAARWLEEHGFDALEDGEVTVRREISTDEGNRAWVNGSPCPQRLLRELGGELLEIHGQHEQQTLLSAERHLEILDRWGGHAARIERVASAYETVLAERGVRDRLLADASRQRAESERLRSLVREIESVNPEPGELERLDGDRRRLRNAERIVALLDQVIAKTYEAEPSATSLAATAARAAAELGEIDPDLVEAASRLASAAVELQDVGSEFRDYRESRSFDTGRLDLLEARSVELERLRLHYGKDEQEVLDSCEEARARLHSFESIDRQIDDARAKVADAERAYVSVGAKLAEARRRAAGRLVAEIGKQLDALALGDARIDVSLTAARGETVSIEGSPEMTLSRLGGERAEFLLAANPGEPFRPLARVASGGELSRIMLALHGLFDAGDRGSTLVFDEVDSGVGGAVADAVGARLATVAERHQVLCVTHLPQVAAYADRHLVVRKRVDDGRTVASVNSLSRSGRVEELARMMGGRETTQVSRRHATEMLGRRSPGPDPAG